MPVAAGLAGAALATVAARTRPFTWPADVVTAVAALPAAVVVVHRLAGGAAGERDVPAAGDVDAAGGQPSAGAPLRWWLAWIGLFAASLAWELVAYVGSPRSAHPTLSALLDSVDSSAAGRAVAFATWLVLGWYVVTR